MPETRNLCAQIPLDLHQRVCEAREESGQTTAQYITQLLTEYFEMKLSAPVIKCKKTPRKKCNFVAEVRKKR